MEAVGCEALTPFHFIRMHTLVPLWFPFFLPFSSFSSFPKRAEETVGAFSGLLAHHRQLGWMIGCSGLVILGPPELPWCCLKIQWFLGWDLHKALCPFIKLIICCFGPIKLNCKENMFGYLFYLISKSRDKNPSFLFSCFLNLNPKWTGSLHWFPSTFYNYNSFIDLKGYV